MKAPPLIKPVEDSALRPLWSVMIPVYNCIQTIEETLRSVLIQAPSEDQMQIEVVDDASTDGDVKQLVEQIGKGRIKYYRQPVNAGSLYNFETCINRAKGQIVHLLHGDDRVRNGYYEKIGELFEAYPHAGAAFCRYAAIDGESKVLWDHGKEMPEKGFLADWLNKIASQQRLQYCTISVKREVYEKLGGYYGVTYGEDWEMWVRIAAHYPVAYTPEILAEYRVHSNSISHRAFLDASHVRDMRWVIKNIQKWLPEETKKTFRKNAGKQYAVYSLDIANKIWHQTGNRWLTHKLLMEAARLYFGKEMILKMLKIYTKMIINRR